MMQVQVNSDNNIEVDTARTEYVQSEVNRALGRFEDHVTRVEVHLSDTNSGKSGTQDKRCVLEARPAGHPPVMVSADAPTVDQAVRGAAGKMKNSLDSLFGRLKDRR